MIMVIIITADVMDIVRFLTYNELDLAMLPC